MAIFTFGLSYAGTAAFAGAAADLLSLVHPCRDGCYKDHLLTAQDYINADNLRLFSFSS